MDLRWPLVGRAAELDRVGRLLRGGGRGVLLAGAAGVGKTRLACECLALAAAEGFVPLRVGATRGAAGLPFGAFASFVPDLSTTANRADVLRRIATAVIARGDGSPVALLVDDAHLLDESSAALTHMLAGGDEPLFMLATLRSGEQASDSVVALWKDGLTERLELEPLGEGEIRELVGLALGGSVDPAAVHRLAESAGGNALFLRELIAGAVDSGTLRHTQGIWRLDGALAISSRLIEIVDARLGDLSDEVARALALVALGEPLGAAVFQHMDGETDLERMEALGLITVQRGGRRLDLRLGHPLYGEVVRARLSPLRARTLIGSLADALQATGARRREDTLRIATLRLDGAGALDAELMLRAATIARRRFDLPLAERLARAAVEAGAGFDAGLLLGQLYGWQGRPAEAASQLASLADAAPGDAERAELASARMDVAAFGFNRIPDAVRIADEAEPQIADITCRDHVTAYRARALGWSGRFTTAARVAEPLLGRASGQTLIAACMAAATSMSLAGRISDAVEATYTGHAAHLALVGPPMTFSPTFHLYLRCLAFNCAGRLAEAQALGEAEYAKAVQAGSMEGQGCFSMFLTVTYIEQGRLAAAVRVGAEAAGICRQLGWAMTMRMGLTPYVRALATVGDVDGARAVLAELDARDIGVTDLASADLLRARAWVQVADGTASDGHAYLEESASVARDGGANALESGALHDLARLGCAADVAARLRELAAVCEGPLPAARGAHASALAAGDARGVMAAAGDFEELGASLLAAEAWTDCAVAWRRDGEPRRATAAERRGQTLAARCEGARTPSLIASAPARASLTPRELEIAQLAARGLANKEIAARLFLSHRTVENKLHTCYEKLGADGRADLARALEA